MVAIEYAIMNDIYDEYIAMEAFGKKKEEAPPPSDFKGKVKYRASQASKYASDKYGAAKKSVTKAGKNIKKTIKKIWAKIVAMFKQMEKRIDKIINTVLKNSRTLVEKGIKVNINTNSKSQSVITSHNVNETKVHDMGNTAKNVMIGAGILFGGITIAGGVAAISAKAKQHVAKANEVVEGAKRFTGMFDSASSEEKKSFINKFGKVLTGMWGGVNKKADQAADKIMKSSDESPNGTEEAQHESSEAAAKTTNAISGVIGAISSFVGNHEKHDVKYTGWKELYENNPERFAEEISKLSPNAQKAIKKDIGYRG